MDSASIRASVVEILTKDFRVPEGKIKDEGTFRGTFGMDSLDAVDFVFLVKKSFAIEAELADFSQVHTLGALVQFLEKKLAEKAGS
jgi:acyl carrier protein